MFYYTEYNSMLGKLTIVSDEENIVGLWIEGQKYFGYPILSQAIRRTNIHVLNKAKNWLDRYFNREKPDISELPLKPIGSDFRQLVWKELCKIPYGEVVTYGEIAKQIAQKENKKTMSAQAIGGAVGHNPIAIIIPCHRVVGVNGSLTGYAGGIDKKEKLLKFEREF